MIKVVYVQESLNLNLKSQTNKATRIKFATKQTPNDYVNEDQR